MWGKSPRGAFYLTIHCGVLPQPVVWKENRAWDENEQEFSTKLEYNFRLNIRSLDMCENAELHCGMKDCCNLRWESENRKILEKRGAMFPFHYQRGGGQHIFCPLSLATL